MYESEVPIAFQLQHALAELGQADNQCLECGSYRVDGMPPVLHRNTCESSGTAEYYRQMATPVDLHTPWIPLGRTESGGMVWWAPAGTVPPTDGLYGPGYDLEDGNP